ncbi:MAG TPA: DUF4232 domain-containing protein, partial [Candidatus Limnocylindrales bacterium]
IPMTRPEPYRPPHLLPVAGLVLVAVLAAACGATTPSSAPPSTPAPSSPAPATSTPTAPPSSSETVCATTDIRATGGPWGGAAGSRGTDVVVVNVGTSSCRLPPTPAVAFVDAAGAVLLASSGGQGGAGPMLQPNGTAGFSAVVSNWCNQSLNLPLRLRLALANGPIDIAGVSVTRLDELPPCNGPGEPASLSATDWSS